VSPAARQTDAAASALRRTIARYAAVYPADRHYVSAKLHTDPLTAELIQAKEPLGDVVDVGCGRGQFGLLLYELGRVTSLFGFDWDPRKVGAAQLAAAGCAEFTTADLRTPPRRSADTILLFDVLQYLSADEQRELLKAVVGCLRPTGRLFIRTADRGSGWQAKFSQFLERCGKALGINQSYVLTFRSSEELKADLVSLGLHVHRAERGHSSLLDNRLWIAQLVPGD